jgi:hypothetical protein
MVRMLWLIGGWGNRPDPLRSSAERLLRSLQSMPQQPDLYGPWGFWRPRDPDPSKGAELVPVDTGDITAVEHAITEVTERGNGGKPRSAPGLRAEFARYVIGERPPTSPTRFAYNVRAGHVDMNRPFNHVALELEADTDERALTRYMGALVEAWQPDHLGAVTQGVKRAQGQRPPEVSIGRLTYVRDGTPLDRSILGDQIDVAEADGGLYIRVPGTPDNPSLEDIHRVRHALGYPEVASA